MKPTDLNILDYQNLVKEFHGESDRAAAVLAGGFIESYLAKYMLSCMVEDKSVKKLFEGFGPFASFSQRYEAAYAFGILSLDRRNDLKYIGKIRNHFAHHPQNTSFHKKPVKDWCAHLSTKKLNVNFPKMQKHSNREVYLLAIAMCFMEWHNSMVVKNENL